jgi:hypothetical protein
MKVLQTPASRLLASCFVAFALGVPATAFLHVARGSEIALVAASFWLGASYWLSRSLTRDNGSASLFAARASIWSVGLAAGMMVSAGLGVFSTIAVLLTFGGFC